MRDDILTQLRNLVNAVEELIFVHEKGGDVEDKINKLKLIIKWSSNE